MTKAKKDLASRYRQWLFLPRPLFRAVTGLRRDVLFLWVPKCAGTSMYKTLVKYGCAEGHWLDPSKPFENRGMVTFGHINTLQLIDTGVVKRDYFDNAFKFSFVRNPFDRVVSLYFYLQRIACEAVPASMTFEEFCRTIGRGEYPPVGLYNYRGMNQCNPMARWLTDANGRLIADFVGRYETLREDFQKLCRRLGIREEVPHENRTEHKPYREYYTGETRSIIERVYREDLDRFNYSF